MITSSSSRIARTLPKENAALKRATQEPHSKDRCMARGCADTGRCWGARWVGSLTAARLLQTDVARELVHVDLARGLFLADILVVGAAQLAQVARCGRDGRARPDRFGVERLLEVLLDRAHEL